MATTLGQYLVVTISPELADWAKAHPDDFLAMKAEVEMCVESCWQDAMQRVTEMSMAKKSKPPKKPPVKGGY